MDQVAGRGGEGGKKDGTTSVTSVVKRLGVDWNIKGREQGGRNWWGIEGTEDEEQETRTSERFLKCDIK